MHIEMYRRQSSRASIPFQAISLPSVALGQTCFLYRRRPMPKALDLFTFWLFLCWPIWSGQGQFLIMEAAVCGRVLGKLMAVPGYP